MTFSYVEFLGIAEERIFRPLIPITFKANKQIFQAYALIDSGSDYTILPIEIAGALGLNISDQPRYDIQGAGGSSFKIYKSPIEIEHVIQKRGFRDIRWFSYVYFSESGTTLLLGQSEFLNRFEIKLNGLKKEIEIIQD